MKKQLAVVFPGQGSQSLGMLAELAGVYPQIKTVFAQASQVLGYDLWALTQNGPKEQLDQTHFTQPALLTASYALWQILSTVQDFQPAMLAGHSLGEYTALVCAGSLTFADAVKLVALRGQFMQDAVKPGEGCMAAIIGLEDSEVQAICQAAVHTATEILAPANFNSLGQVVIAGHTQAVERAMVLAKSAGAKLVTLLPVSVPSHCALMQEAGFNLKAVLEEIPIKPPKLTVINNVDVEPYTTPDTIRAGLVRQLALPVRWVETIQYFIQADITHVVECGPGKVLTGLSKRIDKNLTNLITADINGFSQTITFLNT